MKTTQVFGDNFYIISNYGVARNPIFTRKGDVIIFEKLVEKYLSPVCETIEFGYQHNQFQYLIKVHPREKIEDFYLKKHGNKLSKKKDSSLTIIPETYLIFSQQVSNMLNAYAKRFNKTHGRKGGLFAARYSKILIESEEEFQSWKSTLRDSIPQISFSNLWAVRKIERQNFSKLIFKRGGEKGRLVGEYSSLLRFHAYTSKDLRGCFECLPPKRIDSPNFTFLWQLFLKIKGHNPPW